MFPLAALTICGSSESRCKDTTSGKGIWHFHAFVWIFLHLLMLFLVSHGLISLPWLGFHRLISLPQITRINTDFFLNTNYTNI